MFADNETAKKQYEIDQKNENIIDEEIKEITRHTKNTEDIIKLMEKVRDYRNEIYKLKLMLKNELPEIYQIRNNKELTEMEERTNEDKEVIINNCIEGYIFSAETMDKICDMSDKNHMYPYTNLIKLLEKLKEKDISYTRCGYEGEYVYYTEMVDFTRPFVDTITRNIKIYQYSEPGNGNKEKGIFCIKEDRLEKMKKGGYLMGVGSSKMHTRANDVRKLEEDLTNQINSYRTGEVLQYYEKELKYWQERYLEKAMEINDSEMYIE
jgi:hypothetical protein